MNSPYGCSLSDLQASPPSLPEMKFSSGGETIGWEDMYEFDSCNQVCRLKGTREEIDYDKEFKAMGGTVVENADGSKTYEVEIDGEQIQITINKDGTKVSVTSKSNSPKGEIIAEEIQKGLNDALFDVKGKIDNLDDFMKRFCIFTHNHNQEWKLLVNKGYVSGSWYDYAYHAARGIVISDGMSKTGVNKYDQYDEEFGFWTSYIDKKEGYNMSFDLSKRKKSEELFQDSDVLTVYEYADLMKCIAFQESSFNTGDMNSIGYGGLMGTRGWDINGRNPDFDSFMGIAHGVTEFNIKLKQSKRNRKTTNKQINAGDIKKALGYYYGYYNDNEGNATIPPM